MGQLRNCVNPFMYISCAPFCQISRYPFEVEYWIVVSFSSFMKDCVEMSEGGNNNELSVCPSNKVGNTIFFVNLRLSLALKCLS